jgi:hypothetical protein
LFQMLTSKNLVVTALIANSRAKNQNYSKNEDILAKSKIGGSPLIPISRYTLSKSGKNQNPDLGKNSTSEIGRNLSPETGKNPNSEMVEKTFFGSPTFKKQKLERNSILKIEKVSIPEIGKSSGSEMEKNAFSETPTFEILPQMEDSKLGPQTGSTMSKSGKNQNPDLGKNSSPETGKNSGSDIGRNPKVSELDLQFGTKLGNSNPKTGKGSTPETGKNSNSEMVEKTFFGSPTFKHQKLERNSILEEKAQVPKWEKMHFPRLQHLKYYHKWRIQI